MILLARYMRPMGFKHSGMFDDSASYSLYYKSLPECWAVLVVHNIEARLAEFAGREIELNRLALNMPQIEQYNPPPNPAKTTDSRAADYIEEFGEESWELDALEPTVIATLIRDAVFAARDADKWQAMCEREEAHRADLQRVSDRWEEITGEADE